MCFACKRILLKAVLCIVNDASCVLTLLLIILANAYVTNDDV